MKTKTAITCILMIVISSFWTAALAQGKDATALLQKVKQNYLTIKDYQAKLHIKVDVEFMKVPESDAELFFRSPDKVRIKSDGFVMLPKSEFSYSPISLLDSKYTSFIERDEQVDGALCQVVKLIPSGESDLLLATLWIDAKLHLIRKIETNRKSMGSSTMYLSYDKKLSYPLPTAMKFEFDFSKMPMRRGPGSKSTDNNANKNKPKMGSVVVTYSNYVVNKGIPDEVFKDQSKK